MNYGQLARLVYEKLSAIYEEREAKAIQAYLFRALFPIESHKWLLIKDDEVDSVFLEKVNEALPELLNEKPVQYVVGKAWFNNLEFKVTPDVLIPRGETEELIRQVLKGLNHSKTYNILDIGTGSGAIAISLAKELKNAFVTAMDISSAALEVAKSNAEMHNVKIRLIQKDILEYDNKLQNLNRNPQTYGSKLQKQESEQSGSGVTLPFSAQDGAKPGSKNTLFDIIISNPPYVKESEKALMSTNVLQYEPALALFVEDNDPLQFFRAIISYSKHFLNRTGQLWFEINENHSKGIVNLMKENGFDEIVVYQDLNDKDRYISGLKTL